MQLSPKKEQELELEYRLNLAIFNQNDLARNLSDTLRRFGYEVSESDFQDAKMVTTPEDREYLSDKYGKNFYPSTILVPNSVWLPPKEGGDRGLRDRLGNPEQTGGSFHTYPLLFRRNVHTPEFQVSYSPNLGIKLVTFRTFHEDFHELYKIFRGLSQTPEDFLLNELHSFHQDVCEGQRDWEGVKGAMLYEAIRRYNGHPPNLSDVSSIQLTEPAKELVRMALNAVDNLRLQHEEADCKFIEDKLLDADSLSGLRYTYRPFWLHPKKERVTVKPNY